MRHLRASKFLGPLLLLVVVTLPACHPKRPPAVLSGGPAALPSAEERVGDRSSAEPDLSGGEIQAIGNDVAAGELLPYASSGEEGGPLADIFFEFDQAGLTDAAREVLAKHATWLKARSRVRVAVEGHCDERGTVEYNLALGDKRAQAAREYLVSLGVPASQLNAVSYGKERPIEAGHDEAAWVRNRRVHFAVSQ